MTRAELQDMYIQFVEREKFFLTKFLVPEDRVSYIWSVINKSSELATYTMYVENDFIKAREYFSKCAISREYAYKKCNQSIYSSTASFCYAVLSDNNEVIRRFELFEDHFFKHLGASFGKSVQAALKNDDKALEEQIDLLKKYTKKKSWEKYYAGSINAFDGILQKNKKMAEQGIQEFLAAHHKQDNPPIVRDFFSLEGSALAKLAWRAGLEVEIDHPLVPGEILPVRECPEYPGYDFFREIGY